jgi:hypothetical protein
MPAQPYPQAAGKPGGCNCGANQNPAQAVNAKPQAVNATPVILTQ